MDIFQVLNGIDAAESDAKWQNRGALELALKADIAGDTQSAASHRAKCAGKLQDKSPCRLNRHMQYVARL